MPTDPGTIEGYDIFAERWARRARGKRKIGSEYLEKPAMFSKLPADLAGKRILCLGCGSGEECEALRRRGAEVTGVDISKGLIEQAKYAFPEVRFMVMDMEKLSFPAESFDLVFSSLVLHYVPDWRPTLAQVRQVLKEGGSFLFSTHHPIKWGGQERRGKDAIETVLGFKKYDDESKEAEVFGDYLNSRKITDTWSDEQKVVYYHKSLSEIFREIREAGFTVADFLEPKATAGAEKVRPDFHRIHQKIPLFMIFELK